MTTHKSFYIVLDLHSGGSIQCSIVYKTSEHVRYASENKGCIVEYKYYVKQWPNFKQQFYIYLYT